MSFEQYQRLKKVDLVINLMVLFTGVGITAKDLLEFWWLLIPTGIWQVTSFLFWRSYTPMPCYLKFRKEYGVFLLIILPLIFIWFITLNGISYLTIALGTLLLLVSLTVALWYVTVTYHEAFTQTAEQ